eukprot:TRINITY_DN45815_c0_g1_i1.p1 TRINITY_DN45815_c0_g1~~TRINITY_DN45815_c0_g1_i1.p1  ORF type:complete len:212 (-),score=37.18 TRINITY_DN45815_c0_g1_i1:49-684(-)
MSSSLRQGSSRGSSPAKSPSESFSFKEATHSTNMMFSSPMTPRQSPHRTERSVSPVAQREKPIRPALLEAMLRDSAADVALSLAQDTEAVNMLFLEHQVEPPLCCAIRLGCNIEILRLLLQHGADVHCPNMVGKTPIDLLSEQRNRGNDSPAKAMLTMPPPQCKELLPFLQIASANEVARQGEEQARIESIASLLIAAGSNPMPARFPDSL